VAVTVLDTGIDCAHPERQANIVQYPGFSAFAGANPCAEDNGYGTAVMPALQRKPNLSFAQVLSLLQSTASPLPGFSSWQQGAGLINVEEMPQALQ
jgi:subtilisin family serine protease